MPEGYEQGWNVRYTHRADRPGRFYLRGEEYSAQLDDFVERVAEGDVEGVNELRLRRGDRPGDRHDRRDATRRRGAVGARRRHDAAPPPHVGRRRRHGTPAVGRSGPAGIGGPGRPRADTTGGSMTTTTTERPVAMDRLLFGDNQFFGVNHMSEEKARAQQMRFQGSTPS